MTASAVVPSTPSYASGISDVPLLGDTIGDNFDRTVAAVPDRDALVEVPTDRRWTYAQLRADVDALALGLIDADVVEGDRVGIWAPNMTEWTLLQYASAKVGAVLVNINPSYRTHELEYVLNQAGISVLVSAREFKTSNYEQMIADVRGKCPDHYKIPRYVMVVDEFPMTVTDKVRKVEMREKSVEQLSLGEASTVRNV